MPPIYQAQCNRCSFASDVFPAEYGAVLMDEPLPGPGYAVAGMVLFEAAEEPEIAVQGDPRLLVLAHPLEDYFLEQAGYTWTTLAWAGRYVRVRRVVCKSCGTLFEVRRLTCPPVFGCMSGLMIGLAAGVAHGVWEGNFCSGFWATWFVALGCAAMANLAGMFYARLRFKSRAKEIDGPKCCPKCSSKKYAGVPWLRIFPCPRCGERAMRVRSVGKS